MINNKLMQDNLYRNGVGIMIINNKKNIFVGRRIDNNSNAWQMPQGGIDEGEKEDIALFRELEEETGIPKHGVKILQKSRDYFYYNLPYNLQKKFWGGKYLGQKQRWYLAEFIGDESLIKIDGINPEFCEWQWVEKEKIIELIVNFKKDLYKKIIEEFSNYL